MRSSLPPRRGTVPGWLSRPLPLTAALLVAALSGFINAAAFPALGWWPLIFIGTALMFWSLVGRRVRSALLVGFVGGFAFFGNHIIWLTVYLGPVPWLALAGLEAVFFALGCVLMALAWRYVPRVWSGPGARLIGLPAVLAGLWVLREAITSVWPYGGFSWGRLAFSQSDSTFAPLVAWLGISGVSFVIAFLSAVLLQAVRTGQVRWSTRGMIAATAFLVAALFPAWPVLSSGSIRVAAVQGNSNSGLFAQIQPGDSLDDHLQATVPILGKKVDVIVWPENASDIDPLRNEQAAQTLDFVSKEMNAPLVTGTVTENSKGQTFNSLLLWENGKGSVAQYDKIHPVPFAEYLPNRSFWYPLAPSLFDLVPRDYTFGTRSNVFDINGAMAGLAICFDIVDDGLIHRMVDGGAEFIIAPTNNADFGHSDESVQQVAIARLRAIETGRSVVNDSTVGVSAMFAPDGREIATLPTFTRGALVQTVPLSTTVTPAMFAGRQIEWIVAGFGLASLLVGLLLAPRRPRAQSPRGRRG
ncbi:apolipoprotein N-acyltransferase [Glaciihabitans sp. INWT7]|uniref:apolipoprotein N-acyltransferase n=1 Tax=Glaciihabitans sp. INWT7 TaxID=2596912 RepID=UPI0016242806|nr:apolipoprotein N-acyltransferase [Glaciihabitans sp. INWT7]QNE46688.1 apolipoprotein N-acyltransferase [Glaciihabitans sp. INWT7]